MRRFAFVVLFVAVALGLAVLAWRVLAAGGWSAWEAALFAAYALNAPWLALAGATGLLGATIATLARDPARLLVPALDSGTAEPPTLLAVCLRDEEVDPVLRHLAALLRGLPGPHAIALLSDTTDRARGAAEDAAVARFAAALPPGRVLHRRRTDNAGWKAGNVMDFLDHHAEGFELILLLDADSTMSPALVRRMIGAMGANPRLAILQTTFDGEGAATRFARSLGTAHGPGMRCWATGQAWWQEGQGAYWGHNAILRILPFREHARLDPLPDGTPILSHDFVEAARLHKAGWQVRVLPAPPGQSTERHPPDLAAYLDRDRRWASGNLQWRHLLRDGRLSRLGRLQMLQAMAHYLLGPVWFAILPLAALNAATGGADGTPRDALLLLMALSYLALHAPRLLGHLAERTPAVEVLRESLFLLLFDSLMALDKTLTVAASLAGRQRPAWPAQRREGQGVPWAEAAARLWPHTLAGMAILALLLASGSPFALLVGLPAIAGLLFAIPFCVLTAAPNPPPAATFEARETGRDPA